METDPNSPQAQRRRSTAAYWITECVMAFLFLGALLAADEWAGETGSALSLTLAALPAAVITVWGLLAARRVLALEEFERRVAVNALAIALLVTVWLVTVWALLAQFAGIAAFPSIFVAPLTALVWQVSWFVLRGRYL